MSISQLFPEEGPTLNLNFAGSRTLDPRITFSRSSVGTYMDANGLIVTASADEPRFDHRYVNGEIESLGLLVEESRSNLIRYSNDFSQSNWIKQNSHPTPSKNAVGPDGVANSASTVYRTATNQYLYQSISGGGTYTLSAWVKSEAATGSFNMQGYNATDGTMAESFTATNEWQRFETTISPTTNTGYYPCIPTNTNTNFYVWGVQVESGSFKTSYIPTEGSTKTRNQDRTLIDGEGFTEWYNPTEGTFFCTVNDPKGTVIFGVGNTFDNVIYVTRGAGSMLSNTAGSALSTSSLIGATGNSKIAFAVKTDNSSICVNGTVTANNTTNDMPIGVVRLVIGASSWSPTAFDNQVDGTISQLTYYPVRLSNSQLISLTR